MESQPEIVVAAEALRTWVRAQRAGWAAEQTDRFTTGPSVGMPAAILPFPAAAPGASGVDRARLSDAPDSSVVPRDSRQEDAAAGMTPVSVFDLSGLADADFSAAPPTPLFARASVRTAAALAVVAVLAGGFVMTRHGAEPPAAARRTGKASIVTTPPGSEVTIDGKAAGQTPLTIDLAPGKHVVEFRSKLGTRSQTIEVVRGGQASLAIDWTEKAVGSLRVEARPAPAHVIIDGKDRGTAPLTVADLSVGGHTLQIETPEGSIRRRIEIGAGRTESVSEEIFPGWLHVSSPVEISVIDGRQPVQLDDSNRVLLKPGVHSIRIENRTLGIAEAKQVTIEPGATATVAIEPPDSTLSVTGSTGADVYVDGTKVGETPLADYRIKLGPHDVMVVDRSGATRHANVTVTTAPAQVDIAFPRR